MAQPLSFNAVLTGTLDRTPRLIAPSAGYAALFLVAVGVLIWGAEALPEGGSGFVAFSTLFFGTLFTHSLFSASMYHAVLPTRGGLFGSAWKLTLAWILVIVIAAIAFSIVVLFFSLIGASLGAGSGTPGQDITDMADQIRENGTFWPLFVIFIATLFGLFWFAVRLMTFAAASATRGAVHVFRTWYWTKGAFAVLGPAAVLLIVLPMIAGFWLSGVLISAISSQMSLVGAGLVGALCQLPAAYIGHGFAATIYDHLAPETEPVAD